MWLLLVAGFAIGLSKSLVPLGPAGVLVVQRGLAGRYRNGLALALGGTLVELTYCLAAIFGFQVLIASHETAFLAVRRLGLVVIFGVGIYFVRGPRPAVREVNTDGETPSSSDGWQKDLLLGLSTNALNPAMIVTWSVMVGALASLGFRFKGAARFLFPLSVAVGTFTWDVILLMLLLRRVHPGERTIRVVLRSLGVVLVVAAIWQAVSLWK
jgi:threonine/homoserine/homoserine lactone efflux protein